MHLYKVVRKVPDQCSRVAIILIGFEEFPDVNELIFDSFHFQVVGDDGCGNQFSEANDAIVFVVIA